MAEPKKRIHPDALGRLIRAMDKNSVEVITQLYQLTKSKDEDISYKASKDYLKILAELKEQEDKRDLQRLLVQVKLNMHVKTEDDDDTPTVCFDQIQELT